MTGDETINLLRFVRGASPTRLDEDAPATWGLLLRRVSYADAQHAVVRVLERQTFVSPSEVAAEVRSMRAARIDAAVKWMPTPNVDPDHPAAFQAERAAILRAVGDGSMGPAEAAEYTRRGAVLTGGPRADRAGLPLRRRSLALSIGQPGA